MYQRKRCFGSLYSEAICSPQGIRGGRTGHDEGVFGIYDKEREGGAAIRRRDQICRILQTLRVLAKWSSFCIPPVSERPCIDADRGDIDRRTLYSLFSMSVVSPGIRIFFYN